MTERSGVEIDYCPQCRGVWLDRGELDKIIERAGAQSPVAAPQPVAQQSYSPQPAVHPQFGGHGGHHDSHHKDKHGFGHNKKKSMLSELFDF
jgi:Zn-finger nucleic acid-binding protein